MAEHEVLFKVKVDQAQAARGVKDLAEQTNAAGSAADKAAQSYQRMNNAAASRGGPGGGGVNAGGRAGGGAVSGGPAGMTAGSGRQPPAWSVPQGAADPRSAANVGWGGDDWGKSAATRAAPRAGVRAAASIAAATAIVGHGLEQAAHGLGEVNLADSVEKSFGKLALEFSKGIPIVGSFVKGMHDYINAADSQKIENKIGAEGLAKQAQLSAVNQQGLQIQVDADKSLTPAGFALQDAGIHAREQGALANQVRGNAGRFTRVEDGVQIGAAELAAARAQSESRAGDAIRDAREIDQERAERAFQQTRAQEAAINKSMAKALGKRPDAVQAGAEPEALVKHDQAIQSQELRLAEALLNKQRQGKELLDAQRVSQQAILEAALKRKTAADAETDVLRAQLQITQQKEATVKSGAAQFGMMGQGDQMALVDAAQAMKKDGFESLTSDQRSLLSSNALTSGLLQQGAEAFGQRAPGFQQLLQATGNQNVGQAAKLEQTIVLKVETDADELAEKVRGVLQSKYGEMVKVTAEIVDAAIGVVRLGDIIRNNQP